MTWIDKRLAEREATRVHNLSIDQSAERVYAELWDAIKKCVTEAANKGFDVSTNGSPHHRAVSVLTGTPRGDRKELVLTLKRESHKILVAGIDPAPELMLDLRADNVACLKLNGKQVTYDEAAQAILDPFLFPPPPTDEDEGSGMPSFA
jgi:hypothetical protein